MVDLSASLARAKRDKRLPAVLAYNRIDGPGSSLDLREFQQSLWRMPVMPVAADVDPAMEWTRGLPRTVGMTIDTGTKIHAEPLDGDRIMVRSIDYGTEVSGVLGDIPPTRDNWLLKIIESFRLTGVKVTLHNLRPGLQSSGLGGSATATTGVCILANHLAGEPFSHTQLVAMASRMEQDLGVSITGTQEQANVVFGGVADYVWFPWGIPGRSDSGYGACLVEEIVSPDSYSELEDRFAIYHSGQYRASTDVNSVWTAALSQADGYRAHRQKPDIAYRFREGLRLRRWDDVQESINAYRNVRIAICPAYMDGAREIHGFAEGHGCTTFPLGAGGGGGVLVFSAEPRCLAELHDKIKKDYQRIPFKIRQRGHELVNLPLDRE